MAVNTNINTIQLSQGVVQADGAGQLFANKGNDGQTLIATTGSAAVWANITSTGATITIANGPNTIDLSTDTGPNPKPAVCAIYLDPLSSVAANRTGYPTVFGGAGSVFWGAGNVAGTPTRVWPLYDSTSSWATGNGAGTPASFTAPSTGKYYISVTMSGENVNGFDDVNAVFDIVTSNRTWSADLLFGKPSSGNFRGWWVISTCVADMDIADTATFSVKASSSMGQTYSASFKTLPIGQANPAVIRAPCINIYLVT